MATARAGNRRRARGRVPGGGCGDRMEAVGTGVRGAAVGPLRRQALPERPAGAARQIRELSALAVLTRRRALGDVPDAAARAATARARGSRAAAGHVREPRDDA